ncbi:MAG TPA: ABC transporter substrate binding protein [Exilispira sp.]|nr:ABC transporter substrate binding protein [Exilispira sp.]
MNKKILYRIFILTLIVIVFIIIFQNPIFSNHVNNETLKLKNILILHSYNQGYEWSDNIQRALIDNISVLENVEIYTEYLDANRRDLNDQYLNEFENYLKIKYKDIKFNLLITVDDNAFDFMLKRRMFIFGEDIPMIFCGVNDFDRSRIKGYKNITGVNEEKPIKGNIELILKINEKTYMKLKKIGVIAGSRVSESKNIEAFKKNMSLIPSNIRVDIFENLEFDEILKKLDDYSENDVILYLSYILSPSKLRHHNNINLKKIYEHTKAKIFVVNDHLIKNFVFGGLVVTSYDHGEDAAKMAIRVLKGEDINNIKIKMVAIKKPVFNYGSLLNYKIPFGILPENSILVNLYENDNYREFYKSKKQNDILSYELFQNYGLIMLLIDPENGNIIDANRRAKVFYGYDDITKMKIQDINTVSEEEIKAEMKKAKELNKNYFSFRHRLANGQIRDVEVYSYPIEIYGKKVLFSIINDVTEKVLAEKLKKEEQKRVFIILIAFLIISFLFIFTLSIYYINKRRYTKELEEKNHDLEKANHEIKSLQGIIPICSICKKIRTDEGYWQSVENYISNHSEALFSHSICPDCAKKYYGIDVNEVKDSD